MVAAQPGAGADGDAAARARCCTLLGYDRPGMSRPGNIEEFWYLDGLLDRLRALDE